MPEPPARPAAPPAAAVDTPGPAGAAAACGAPPVAAATTPPQPARRSPRRRALTALAMGIGVTAVGWAGYGWLVLRHAEFTDNAYVQGNVVQITPQVAGTVVAILADDTDVVKAGQPLVRLDAADARLTLAQAEAALGQTVREVRTLYAGNATLAAQVAGREAELVRAQAEVARAQDDVNRRAPLLATGAIGQEDLAHARAQLAGARAAQEAAQSALAAAREALATHQGLTDGTSVTDHPSVQQAAGRVREAYVALQRTTLPAPLDGMVARRSVQIGQRVAAGAPLMAVVALDTLWVDANFKEAQLRELRIGQPARLTADVYGRRVSFRGTVLGLGAGTGAAFALLPAQNATGNWIKVVQRVPVRIGLQAQDLAAHPLRVGLSMEVTVDTSDTAGRTLADAPRGQPLAQTAVFDVVGAAADAEVARVIRQHLGRGAAAPSR